MKEKQEKEVHIKVATIDSMWTPCGLHVDSMWTPCGLHVDSIYPRCVWSYCVNFSAHHGTRIWRRSQSRPWSGTQLSAVSGISPVSNHSNMLALKELKSSQSNMFQVRYLYTGVVDQAALDSDELAVNLLEARKSI